MSRAARSTPATSLFVTVLLVGGVSLSACGGGEESRGDRIADITGEQVRIVLSDALLSGGTPSGDALSMAEELSDADRDVACIDDGGGANYACSVTLTGKSGRTLVSGKMDVRCEKGDDPRCITTETPDLRGPAVDAAGDRL